MYVPSSRTRVVQRLIRHTGLSLRTTARRSTSTSSRRVCSWPRRTTTCPNTQISRSRTSLYVSLPQAHNAKENRLSTTDTVQHLRVKDKTNRSCLQVVKACQSLTSRGYLKTRFSWQYYYYTLTPEGLDYLREWLHLPAEIVPATHIKQQRSHAPPRGMMGGDGDRPRGRGGPRRDGEGGYRRREQGDKEGAAPGDYQPSFRGGFGRGRGRGEAPPS